MEAHTSSVASSSNTEKVVTWRDDWSTPYLRCFGCALEGSNDAPNDLFFWLGALIRPTHICSFFTVGH